VPERSFCCVFSKLFTYLFAFIPTSVATVYEVMFVGWMTFMKEKEQDRYA